MMIKVAALQTCEKLTYMIEREVYRRLKCQRQATGERLRLDVCRHMKWRCRCARAWQPVRHGTVICRSTLKKIGAHVEGGPYLLIVRPTRCLFHLVLPLYAKIYTKLNTAQPKK